jgi:hypothetical protein
MNRRGATALAVAAIALATAGCLQYDAAIRVASDGKVAVHERMAVDPEWAEEAGDTFQAAERVITQMVLEAKKRGGKVERFGRDSVHVDFEYRSLASFARAWPDSADEGKQWDRALYRRLQDPAGAMEQLILWRQSPPDRSKETQHQRYPVLSFTVTLPVPAARQNAHWSAGRTYGWRFTEKMTKPDSVWIVWPAGAAH